MIKSFKRKKQGWLNNGHSEQFAIEFSKKAVFEAWDDRPFANAVGAVCKLVNTDEVDELCLKLKDDPHLVAKLRRFLEESGRLKAERKKENKERETISSDESFFSRLFQLCLTDPGSCSELRFNRYLPLDAQIDDLLGGNGNDPLLRTLRAFCKGWGDSRYPNERHRMVLHR